MRKALGNIATFQRGLTYNKGDEVPSSSKVVLRSNNIDLESHSLDLSELKYLREDFIIPEDRKVRKNSIFICMSNGSKQHVGKVAFIDRDMDYAFGGFMGLIVPAENVSAKYVFYACNSAAYRTFLTQVGNGIGITNLRFSDLERFEIPVPSIEEQQRIVDELDLLSGIIDKKNAQLRDLDAMAQSFFYEMFGDPAINEKGWPVKLISDLFDVGSSKRVFESEWRDSGVPFYRAREIVRLSKGLPLEDPIFIEESLFAAYREKYGIPAAGDIMVTGVGTLGICYLVKKEDRFYFKDGNTLWFRDKHIANSRFVKDQYSTDFVKDQIKENAHGATVGTYTIVNAKKTRVICPPVELQNEYVKKVQAVDKQKLLIEKSIADTQNLLDSRMHNYFG